MAKRIASDIGGQLEADKKGIAANAAALELIIRCVPDIDVAARLNELLGEIKYLNPSTEKNIAAYQQRISDKIGDMKLVVTKARKNSVKSSVLPIIEEIYYIIAERNSKM